jgi:hypothetical protein
MTFLKKDEKWDEDSDSDDYDNDDDRTATQQRRL